MGVSIEQFKPNANGIVPRAQAFQNFNPFQAATQGIDQANAISAQATNDAMARRVAQDAAARNKANNEYMTRLGASNTAAQNAINNGGASSGGPSTTPTGSYSGNNAWAASRGNPDQSGWAAQHLVTVKDGAIRYTVNKNASAAFQGFLHALTNSGYKVSTVQGYNNRGMRSDPSKKSEHAYGDAIDINPGQNPANFNGQLHTNMPTWVGALAAKYGLVWGGNWKRMPDPMHFEYAPNGVSGAGNSVQGYSGKSSTSKSKTTSKKTPAKPAPKSGGSFNFATAGTGK